MAHRSYSDPKPEDLVVEELVVEEPEVEVEVEEPAAEVENPEPTAEPDGGTQGPEKSLDEIVREVLAGKWGVGQERRLRLSKAGYDHQKVQDEIIRQVNEAWPQAKR